MLHVDRWSALSHLAGAIAAAAGAVALVVSSVAGGDPWTIGAMAVYGTTLVALYACSTLYHSSTSSRKPIYRKLDHVAIYLLIAGTYTPFLLGPLRGRLGWSLLAVVWTMAVLGIAQDVLGLDRRRIVSVVIYLAMGWLALGAAGPLMRALPAMASVGLLAGGLAYTGGVVFYACDHRWPVAHVIWHGFVLAGSTLHFIVIARYLT